MIAAQSLLVTVRGEQIRQDPQWLDGLPEYVNWGGSLLLDSSVGETLQSGIPEGVQCEVSAGNRHGPSANFQWNGHRWAGSRRRTRIDPRLKKLSPTDDELELRFVSGHTFVMQLNQGKLESFRFDPGNGHAKTLPLPPLETESLYRASLVGNDAREAWFCSREGSILRYRDEQWSAVTSAKQGSSASSCAVTSDGSLWWVHWDGKGSLFQLDSEGQWTEVSLPARHSVDAIYATGERLWLSLAHQDRNLTLVISNRAVAEPIELTAEQMPVDPSTLGIPGLDVTTVDVPSVSPIPAGPGSPACTSLALWLGVTLDPELLFALRSLPEAHDLDLLQVMAMAPGEVVYPVVGSPFGVVKPSGRLRPAFALAPLDFARGRAIEGALATALTTANKLRLLCAVPKVTRRLGSLGQSG